MATIIVILQMLGPLFFSPAAGFENCVRPLAQVFLDHANKHCLLVGDGPHDLQTTPLFYLTLNSVEPLAIFANAALKIENGKILAIAKVLGPFHLLPHRFHSRPKSFGFAMHHCRPQQLSAVDTHCGPALRDRVSSEKQLNNGGQQNELLDLSQNGYMEKLSHLSRTEGLCFGGPQANNSGARISVLGSRTCIVSDLGSRIIWFATL